MENIKFVGALAIDPNTVNVFYQTGPEHFTLQWSNLCSSTGDECSYFSIEDIESECCELELKIRQILDDGEEGDCAEIYYLLRDQFDSSLVAEVASEFDKKLRIKG